MGAASWIDHNRRTVMQQKRVRIQFAGAMLSYCEHRNISAIQLCSLAGISLDFILGSHTEDLSHDDLRALWHHAVSLSGDPLFGLHFGESLQLAALGIVGEVIKSSPSIGAALEAACSLIPQITDLCSASVAIATDQFSVELSVTDEPISNISRHIADFLMVFCVHELDGLVLRKVTPLKVKIPGSSFNSAEYGRVFRCTPNFGAHNYQVTFDGELLRAPLLTANYETQQALLDIVAAAKNTKINQKSSFHSKVQDYVSGNVYLGIPTLQEVAANFNMTPRSLQRRLRGESTSYQQIADEIRRKLAVEYIKTGRYPIKEISAILGYNEVSAFSRAFKRWTGQPPVTYNV